jgi:hypothetical protein
LVVGSIPTRPTISLKNNKFFDLSRKKLKTFPHRSEFRKRSIFHTLPGLRIA